MSLKKSLIKEALFYGVGDMLTKAIAFVLIPLYTNALPPKEYGIYQLLVLFITTAMVFVMSGMNAALFKHFVVTKDETLRRRYFTATVVWVVISSVILVGLSYLLARPLSYLLTGNYGRGGLVGLAAINAGLEALILVSLLIFRMEKRPIGYVSYNVVKVVLIVAGNILLVWFLNMGVSGIILAGIAADVIILAPLLWRVGHYLTLPLSFRFIWPLFLWGIPFVPSSIASVILTLSDRLILRFMAGLGPAGIYSVGYKLAGVVFLFYTAFRFAWGPYMFELGRDTTVANRTYPKVLLPLISFLGLSAVGLVGISPELYRFFVGEAYHASRAVLIPVSLAAMFEAMALFFGAGMQTRDRTIYLPFVTGMAAILNIALNIWLIPRFGFMGAAWATLISYVVMAYMHLRLGDPLMPVKYPWPKIAAIVLITAMGITAVWFLGPLVSRLGAILATAALLWVTSGGISGAIRQVTSITYGIKRNT